MKNSLYRGQFRCDSLRFRPNNLTRIDAHIDSKLIGTLQPDFLRNHKETYEAFHTVLQRSAENLSTGITYDEFKKGYVLMCFDSDANLHLGNYPSRTAGQYNLTLYFNPSSGDESLSVICLGEFANWVTFDVDRCVDLHEPI